MLPCAVQNHGSTERAQCAICHRSVPKNNDLVKKKSNKHTNHDS